MSKPKPKNPEELHEVPATAITTRRMRVPIDDRRKSELAFDLCSVLGLIEDRSEDLRELNKERKGEIATLQTRCREMRRSIEEGKELRDVEVYKTIDLDSNRIIVREATKVLPLKDGEHADIILGQVLEERALSGPERDEAAQGNLL